jgi:hypothetical protein
MEEELRSFNTTRRYEAKRKKGNKMYGSITYEDVMEGEKRCLYKHQRKVSRPEGVYR